MASSDAVDRDVWRSDRWPRSTLPELNIRQLESFHTVAQEGNITRAAARLHLTQQTLSAQIKQLERVLGAVLLVRDSRGVRLTAAGEIFAEGAGAMLTGLAGLSERVNHAAGQSINRLRVVFCPQSTAPFVIRVANELEAADPTLRVVLVSVRSMAETLCELETGRADAALMWLPIEASGLRYTVIGSDGWVAVFARDEDFADRDRVLLAELTSAPLVLPGIFMSAAAERYWAAALRPGPELPEATVADTADGPIIAARRQGIWLAPESLGRRNADANNRVVRIADAPPIEAAVVWTIQAPQPLITLLVRAIRAAVEVNR
ncbi:LysR family transcriptional regulator [Nocardia sp. SYP-A9097]|uniref:LysR family transcriptional regulator n=1 Tax=Nocardia sp. SYP-A9097 TaxID=2663237 RepID=UPI00129C06CC|nr:LysR family transcriptional regulator [Nocardia sp. SYP-A9097]MRH88056.1 LysR family transcriptional regulator [Nocardia sp. SYP-A9097]